MGGCVANRRRNSDLDRRVAEDKLGGCVAYLPWGLRNMVFRAAVQAEIRLGRPAIRNEVYNQLGL